MNSQSKWTRLANAGGRFLSALLLFAIFALSVPGPARAAGNGYVATYPFVAGQTGLPFFSDPDPNPEPEAAQEALAASAQLRARVTGRRVLSVWGTGFNRRHVYYVKVRAGTSGTWKKVGRIRPDYNGDLQGQYLIPAGMRRARLYRVCLKEINRNYQICTTARVN